MSLHPAGSRSRGTMSVAEAMSLTRKSKYLYPDQDEFTIEEVNIFIKNKLPEYMIETLNNSLTFDMHKKIARLAINHHTYGWAFDPSGKRMKTLTFDDCTNDLKKIYIMYYNVYTMSLMPKGQFRDAYDPMKNFKNRLRVIQANMFLNTCIDGNTIPPEHQDTVVIPNAY